MTTQKLSAELKKSVQSNLGDGFAILADDIERVKDSGLVDKALKVGATAPAFILPDAFGNHLSSKQLLAAGPLVVSFYRGEWCPFCNIELRGLQQILPQIKSLGASLVAISPEKPDGGMTMTEKNELTYPVLSDCGNKVARQFGLVFQMSQTAYEFAISTFKNDLAQKNADGSTELPVPATFIIGTDGVIKFAHVDVDYMVGRVDPQAVVKALEGLAP